MRTDVKLGVVISMVVVFVAGGYFLFKGDEAKPIDLAENAANPALTKEAGRSAPANTQTADTGNSRKNPNTLPNRTRQPNRPLVPQNQPNSTIDNANTQLAQNTRAPADGTPPSTFNQPNVNPPVTQAANQPASNPTEMGTSTTDHAGQPQGGTPGGELQPSSAAEALAAMRKTAQESAPLNKPATAAVDIHRAQPGDTFLTLAQTYYGSSKYALFLRQANPDISDSSIRVGTAIRIPSLPADASTVADSSASRPNPLGSPAGANAPKPAGGSRTYVVRPGDSFYKIAERELGKASRWKELLALNKSLVDGDPTRLRVGQKVVLPES